MSAIKERIAFLLALAGTVFAMSANLHAVTGQSPEAATFAVTLCVIALWLACAVFCGKGTFSDIATLSLMLCVVFVGSLGFIPAFSGNKTVLLAYALAVAPFYGLGALCGGPVETMLLISAVCVFIGLFHVAVRRMYAMRQDADILALERETADSESGPDMAAALSSKAKRLLGLRDPEARRAPARERSAR